MAEYTAINLVRLPFGGYVVVGISKTGHTVTDPKRETVMLVACSDRAELIDWLARNLPGDDLVDATDPPPPLTGFGRRHVNYHEGRRDTVQVRPLAAQQLNPSLLGYGNVLTNQPSPPYGSQTNSEMDREGNLLTTDIAAKSLSESMFKRLILGRFMEPNEKEE